MHSNDPDTSNHVSLSNTLDDTQGGTIVIETITVNSVVQVESAPQETQTSVKLIEFEQSKVDEPLPVDVPQPDSEESQVSVKMVRIEPSPADDTVPVEEEEEPPDDDDYLSPSDIPTESSFGKLRDERLKEIQMRREPVTFVKKAQQFSEIVNEPPKVRIRATTKEMSDAHLQVVDRERKAVISQSMMKRRGADGPQTTVVAVEDELEGKDNYILSSARV